MPDLDNGNAGVQRDNKCLMRKYLESCIALLLNLAFAGLERLFVSEFNLFVAMVTRIAIQLLSPGLG